MPHPSCHIMLSTMLSHSKQGSIRCGLLPWKLLASREVRINLFSSCIAQWQQQKINEVTSSLVYPLSIAKYISASTGDWAAFQNLNNYCSWEEQLLSRADIKTLYQKCYLLCGSLSLLFFFFSIAKMRWAEYFCFLKLRMLKSQFSALWY